MHETHRALAHIVVFVIACVALVREVQSSEPASSYPNKPVRIVVAAAAGGGSDIVTRLIMAGRLAERWRTSFVLEARPGASGTIAADIVARAPKDGYTLLAAAPPLITVPLITDVPYDVERDLAPVARFLSQPSVLVSASSLPITSVKELIAYARSKPGVLNYASNGSGTSPHLSMELLKSMAGIRLEHISYKGTAETMNALLGGHVDVLFGSAAGVMPHAKSGKVRMLAVTSLKRSQFLPDVPTIAESGVPEFEVVGWYGLLAPAGTPRATVDMLNREINQILLLPDIRDKLAADGSETTPGTAAEFKAFIAKESNKWKRLLTVSNLKL